VRERREKEEDEGVACVMNRYGNGGFFFLFFLFLMRHVLDFADWSDSGINKFFSVSFFLFLFPWFLPNWRLCTCQLFAFLWASGTF
jgi:hypothetical protein